MSLRQLLFVNESVQRENNGPSPYRLTNTKALPLLAPEDRRTAALRAREDACASIAPLRNNPFARPAMPREEAPAQPAEAAGEVKTVQSSSGSKEQAGNDATAIESSDRWSVLASGRNRRRSPFRQESCLREVAVVRNDLSESDFEVVPVPPPSKAAPSPSGKRDGTARAKGIWDRLTAQLFSLGLGWFKA